MKLDWRAIWRDYDKWSRSVWLSWPNQKRWLARRITRELKEKGK